ncbi:D-alanine--D-alanine ligase [Patescibacteria group bacterium]|nr:D-alanine--D-alanine ligase [Patescibacteria group bacterium]
MNAESVNVGILFGGKSTEHEVSVITGVQVLNGIDKNKYNILPIYVSKEGKWYISEKFYDIKTFKDLDSIPKHSKEVFLSPIPGELKLTVLSTFLFGGDKNIKADVFFPCFHGGLGECGGFQGLFEIAEVPYVGAEILSSAVSMDKILMKDVFKANNIPSFPYYWFYREYWKSNNKKVLDKIEEKFKYPVFVKPSNSGSSIGVAKVEDRESLENCIEVACVFDRRVIVEKGILGAKEINVSVIGNSGSELLVSECEEVFSEGGFLSYEDKYIRDGKKSKGMASAKRIIPANISAKEKIVAQELAKEVFSALNCCGIARVDFLIRGKDIYVLEINTIPGSLSFYLWEASGLKFKDVLDKLIQLAMDRYKYKSENVCTFPTNILQNFEAGIKGKL